MFQGSQKTLQKHHETIIIPLDKLEKSEWQQKPTAVAYEVPRKHKQK